MSVTPSDVGSGAYNAASWNGSRPFIVTGSSVFIVWCCTETKKAMCVSISMSVCVLSVMDAVESLQPVPAGLQRPKIAARHRP